MGQKEIKLKCLTSLMISLGFGLVFFSSSCVQSYKDQRDTESLKLHVSENHRYLAHEDGSPFFWLGGTSWGMPEWLNREDVDLYLDNRKEKGFSVIQLCLVWGKRVEDPTNFTCNPPNAYGFRAFMETEGNIDPGNPWEISGGTPENPNDYWDHVEYIIQAAAQRNILVALLPVWGRRYVNATHSGFSKALFSIQDMRSYGRFLGQSYSGYSNIIWVLGGDVGADDGGDYLNHYRSMAEGILTGLSGEEVHWNEESPLWDLALFTYHPDGKPLRNSSQWFHHDPWLDFHMIETFQHRDQVYEAVQNDYALKLPVKPTVMGEPAYEGEGKKLGNSSGLQMRRQAYQTFFGGAAGFTYGAFRDKEGNGPLFSPYTGWENMLDLEGANTMKYLKSFCLSYNWPDWLPVHDLLQSDKGEGELQKVSVLSESSGECFIYYPDNSPGLLDFSSYMPATKQLKARWYNPSRGEYTDKIKIHHSIQGRGMKPPDNWPDAVLIVSGLKSS